MSKQNDSTLFRLPAELRNHIYVELLCPRALSWTALARRSKSQNAGRLQRPSTYSQLCPALLSTCRKVHNEAIGFLYATHVFQAHPSLLTSFPHLTSPEKPIADPTALSRIKRWQITIRLDVDPRFELGQCTSAFSGAEYFEVRAWQAACNGAADSVLRLFAGIRGVRVAKVHGSVDAGLARWLESRMTRPPEQNQLCQCGEHRRPWHCKDCGKIVAYVDNGRRSRREGRKRRYWE